MARNSDIKQHISTAERAKWNKVGTDLAAHTGAGGTNNHAMGNGTVPGFSTNDYTNKEKTKLAGIEEGALNNPHPSSHPYTMITGLSTVAHTGSYENLLNIPSSFYAGGGNSDTVGGITISVSASAPSNPTNNKNIWFDTTTMLIKVYKNNAWTAFSAVFGS